MNTIETAVLALLYTMPPSAHYERTIGALGVGSVVLVVAYDSHGIMSAPRIWWMFRAFGHQKVAVLNDGLPKWKREGLPLGSGTPRYKPKKFEAADPSQMVRTTEQAVESLGKAVQIVDARATSRFQGLHPAPRPGLRSGHIPGSHNVHYATLVNSKDGTLLPPKLLAEKIRHAGVDIRRPAIVSCGSGVSASVLALAFNVMEAGDVPVYDGSWTEWGSSLDGPVATGSHTKVGE